ncbi:MAG: FcoT family thioesterase [Candidatus Woesearchaeota archaeon]
MTDPDLVNQNTLDTILKEYPEDFKMLHKAEFYSPNRLKGYLKTSPDWGYSGDRASPVNHFTAGEAVFSHNQMSYILLTCMAERGLLENVHPLPLDVMNQKKFNGLLITEIGMTFSKPFLSSEEYTCEFNIESSLVKQTRSGIYLFLHSTFDFENGKSQGYSKGVLKLEEHEIIDKNRLAISRKLQAQDDG